MAPITTDLDKIRLELGDTDPARQLLTDDELNYFLSEHDTVLLAAAAACDSLATRFARDYDVKWQGAGMSARGEYSRSQMVAAFAERARALRERAGGGVGTIVTTRVDGYSDDLSNRDGAGQASRTGRVRAGYTDPDLPI